MSCLGFPKIPYLFPKYLSDNKISKPGKQEEETFKELEVLGGKLESLQVGEGVNGSLIIGQTYFV